MHIYLLTHLISQKDCIFIGSVNGRPVRSASMSMKRRKAAGGGLPIAEGGPAPAPAPAEEDDDDDDDELDLDDLEYGAIALVCGTCAVDAATVRCNDCARRYCHGCYQTTHTELPSHTSVLLRDHTSATTTAPTTVGGNNRTSTMELNDYLQGGMLNIAETEQEKDQQHANNDEAAAATPPPAKPPRCTRTSTGTGSPRSPLPPTTITSSSLSAAPAQLGSKVSSEVPPVPSSPGAEVDNGSLYRMLNVDAGALRRMILAINQFSSVQSRVELADSFSVCAREQLDVGFHVPLMLGACVDGPRAGAHTVRCRHAMTSQVSVSAVTTL